MRDIRGRQFGVQFKITRFAHRVYTTLASLIGKKPWKANKIKW